MNNKTFNCHAWCWLASSLTMLKRRFSRRLLWTTKINSYNFYTNDRGNTCRKINRIAPQEYLTNSGWNISKVLEKVFWVWITISETFLSQFSHKSLKFNLTTVDATWKQEIKNWTIFNNPESWNKIEYDLYLSRYEGISLWF